MTALLPTPVHDPRATMAQHGRSFHHAARLLGPTHAARAARLYTWCRTLDDLADDAASPADRAAASQRLGALRTALLTEDGRDPLAAPLLDLCDEVAGDPRPAITLVAGVRSDLGRVALPDERALVRYSHAVAGTVGLLMLPVLGVHHPAARPFAVDLGIGMQLTNIARDVVEDAHRGRRYLPATWVGDLTPDQLERADPATRAVVRAGVARLLGLAEHYYASAEAGLVHLPLRPRAAIRVATRVYRRIGRRLARRDHDVWAGRTVVPAAMRGAVTLGALAAEVRPGDPTPVHDPALHRHLTGSVGVAA